MPPNRARAQALAIVIPAKAGTSGPEISVGLPEIPAFARMTACASGANPRPLCRSIFHAKTQRARSAPRRPCRRETQLYRDDREFVRFAKSSRLCVFAFKK
jgi:hypothetical protein